MHLICPICRSDRYAEFYESKRSDSGFSVYCRRCEEGCVDAIDTDMNKPTTVSERFQYNVETTTRFDALNHRVKTAKSLEVRYAVTESIAEVEKLVTDAQNLLVHLRAWDRYHPSKK